MKSTHPDPALRARQTNGVVERFNQSLKYEHLYRHEIADGQQLTELIDKYLEVYNAIRPYEELAFYTPSDVFHGRFIPNPKSQKLSEILDTGHFIKHLLRQHSTGSAS